MNKVVKWSQRWLILGLVLLFVNSPVYAAEGEMGFFGGVSEGSYQPKLIEKYVPVDVDETNTYVYKEVVFMTGRPVEVTGTIEVTLEHIDLDKNPSGIIEEVYVIEAANEAEGVTLEREVELETSYWLSEGTFKRQLRKESRLVAWEETIVTAAGTFTLDEDTAIFSKTTIEDITPGITYYNTIVSYTIYYLDDNNNRIEYVVDSDVYGYKQPWSKVETQYMNVAINSQTDGLNLYMDITVNPRLEAKKTIYYNDNTPYPISFGGTYNQRMERQGTLSYRINSYHPELKTSEQGGRFILKTANQIEKLIIPEGLDFMEGHWAEEDVKKMYSMEIFTSTPQEGIQFQAMTRGEFVKALCLAMDIDISKYEKVNRASQQMFGDVPPSHRLYPYIMGAFDAKLINGTGENFDISKPITREEAFVIYIRVIGLERLGVTNAPRTPFVDDNQISSWAKKEIMAGYHLGIIQGDVSGRVLPKQWIAKTEAAAIINRLIDYLREDIGRDY
jgi:hypothetical protein